jgi:hypothetical protein
MLPLVVEAKGAALPEKCKKASWGSLAGSLEST